MGLGIISPNYRPKYMCKLLKPYLPYCTQNFNVEKALRRRRRRGEYNSSDYSSNSRVKNRPSVNPNGISVHDIRTEATRL